MRHVVLALAAVAAAFGQSQAQLPAPPDPPACLTAPVTKGSVTLSCSLIDNTGAFGADPGLFSGGVQYVLQVRVVSSDPDVIGIIVSVTSLLPASTPNAAPSSATQVRSISKTCSTNGPAVPGRGDTPGPYAYRYSLWVDSAAITAIQIDETKRSSSQVF